jgi:hypothetical protein
MANLATYHQDAVTKAARAAQVPAADFDGGVNKGGSCAGGIGLNTGDVDPKLDDWTVLDQAGAARAPQNSQHIGGDGTAAGNTASEPLRAVQGADVNDTLSYVTAIVTAADGVGVGTANADPINRTGKTVTAGERLWGTNTVA